ncbi:tumor necrosis factor ligand superfamily member 18 [Pteropus alecto]|uniref:Tumor necrosis factor ligand superfamily member 18 n=2 Tax=Pteropus TaxID=9401 RepID=A0A6P3QT26_PTEVA|nr:tumor necrosis factor ligand superfamily member 18 [Pteropus alecto]XP_011369999.1 tumor necrosis factor ligand superfamily member 18 [Pteropus vampyrus]ELK16269.1 Tumor necrosis factor ligand superfamily member 18 [Pteropus alecto]
MSLRHMENLPLHHPSPPGAQRLSWKRWLLYSLIAFLLFLYFSALLFTLLSSKTVNETCVAKFGPSPSKWQMASAKPSCVKKRADWKLEILEKGLYVIYGQVAPNTSYKEPAPFEVRLRKNENIIQTLTDNTKIQNVGGTYELHAGDVIDLIFNSEHQVLENSTYWGILMLATPPLHFLES